MMSYSFGVLLFGLGIAVTIALHEWGHFATARFFGMKVRRFFVGFGPTVFSFKRGETEYGFKLIPLGGFCDIAGMTNQDEVTEDEKPRAMVNKPWWQRVIVLLGGIIMNLIVATTVLYGLAVTSGLPNPNPDTTAVVGQTGCVAPAQKPTGELEACTGVGPAGEAGLKAGDRIIAADGKALESFADLREYVMAKPDETVSLTVVRDGKELDLDITVASAQRLNEKGELHTVGAIGVTSAPLDLFKTYGPVEAIGATANFSATVVGDTLRGLAAFPAKIPGVVASIFGAERQLDGPVSVVGASRVGGELVEHSMWPMFFMMLASLNFFLAFFNLVPLPPLDGGHIAVVLYEKVRDFFRRLRGLAPAGPADYSKLMPITIGFAAILMGVGAIVIIADVVNPIRIFG
ncbi:MAG: site-2 protease family protein [Corynebacterium sp.]|uniref:M50 family metallopeptidase n=1 Tax=Corynebacterium sp. TaxID=1720 RepID=UPI0026DC0A0F|nr:site-2 protease family protein [Corynebacterium sp.]MDO4761518.1 site-2 protease family protein [Corynebacterium sp.]